MNFEQFKSKNEKVLQFLHNYCKDDEKIYETYLQTHEEVTKRIAANLDQSQKRSNKSHISARTQQQLPSMTLIKVNSWETAWKKHADTILPLFMTQLQKKMKNVKILFKNYESVKAKQDKELKIQKIEQLEQGQILVMFMCKTKQNQTHPNVFTICIPSKLKPKNQFNQIHCSDQLFLFAKNQQLFKVDSVEAKNIVTIHSQYIKIDLKIQINFKSALITSKNPKLQSLISIHSNVKSLQMISPESIQHVVFYSIQKSN